MTNYYTSLGVARTATAAEIKQAFRKLASQHHPDKGGDTVKFQEIQAAYAVLGDEQKRAEYDSPPSPRIHINPGGGFNFDQIFEVFGTQFRNPAQQSAARIQLWISLADVAKGGPRTISVSSPAGSQNIEINIPAGIEDGASVRYARLAPGGIDLVVMFRIRPEPGWHRQDNNIIHDVTLDLWDLVLGRDFEIQTLTGKAVIIVVPPMTEPGTMLRVRGLGLPHKNSATTGDLLIRVAGRLPKKISPELLEQINSERGR